MTMDRRVWSFARALLGRCRGSGGGSALRVFFFYGFGGAGALSHIHRADRAGGHSGKLPRAVRDRAGKTLRTSADARLVVLDKLEARHHSKESNPWPHRAAIH